MNIKKISLFAITIITLFVLIACTANAVEFTITFDSNGGNQIDDIEIESGKLANLPIPIKEGFTFIGWFTGYGQNDIQFSNFIPVLSDTTLYAKWSINSYTINFVTNGGTIIDSVTQDYNTELLFPNEPTKLGYTFEGWYAEQEFSTLIESLVIPAEDITLYAKWTINQYTITFDVVNQDLLEYIIFNPGDKIVQVSLGSYHSYALTSSGRRFMWGENYYGQSGDGTRYTKYFDFAPTEITNQFSLDSGDQIIQVSLGLEHSSALTSSGRFFMWGRNSSGQLGDGTTTDHLVPTEITSRFSLASGDKIIRVSLGASHSSALTSNGRLFMWGKNSHGQLGDGTTTDQLVPTEITSRFSLVSDDKIIQVSLGGLHSSALTSSGRLFMWGRNENAALGDGTTTDQLVPTEITSRFILVSDDKIIQVYLGAHHSSALTSSGRLFMWGWNFSGQLGDGTTTDQLVPTEITRRFSLVSDDKIIQVSLGGLHSSALTSSGRLFMWGSNRDNVLGGGITIYRNTPVEFVFYTPDLDSTITYTYQDVIDDYIPILEGYTFDGWYTDIELTIPYIFTIMPSSNIVVYGKWIAD